MSNAQQALFDKYGGVPVITGLVGTFYARVMDSERLAPYFVGIDMPRLIAHQVAFFRQAMGKPSEEFTHQRMADAHQPLRVTEADFDEVVSILTGVLEEAGVEPEDLLAVVGAVAAYADDIIVR